MKPVRFLLAVLCFWTLLVLPAGLLLAQGRHSERAAIGNFDRRESLPAGAASLKSLVGAEAALKGQLPAVQVERHPVTGSARFIGSPRSFLTGPKGAGLAAGAAAGALPESDSLRGLKAFLSSQRAVVGHGEEVLNGAAVERDYVDAHNGLRTVVWRQQVGGIPVFEGLLKAHVTRAGELVNVGSGFVADAEKAADNGLPNRAQALATPKISVRRAVALAAAELGESLKETALASKPGPAGPTQKQQFQHAAFGDLSAQYVWLPVDAETLRLCWQVILTSRKRGEMFRVLVDAETGGAWLLHNLTHYISDASYRVFTEDSPTPMSPGLSVPGNAQPAEVARVLVTTPALSQTASPNGWIDDGVNETRGNNVDAHTDLDDDDAPDLPRPQGAPFRVFDSPLNLTQDPSTYRNASVVNLFYLCNMIHDRFYGLGFTEAAGNFQINNFGRGGVGGDAVQADAHDGGGFNNANFSTPPDGGAGRMQMYLFNGPTPKRDGSLDAEIVIHEYTHGLSNRLVGGGIGISALQTAGMGEGWSDFYALCLLAKAGDNPAGNYAAGAYASHRLAGLQQNYYFGIRRYPYSTNLSANPLTFKDIAVAQASDHGGIPMNPIFGSFNAADATEVHNMGEVWCSALWEVRANLIAKHGFDTGNQLVLQLVTDGMKLAPANPNFLQARNAILQADLVGNAGANRGEIWAGFAKRGMGDSATSPSSSSTAGLSEAFDLPSALEVTDFSTQFQGPRGGPFNPASGTFTLTNYSDAALNWNVSQAPAWLNLSPSSGTLAAGASATVTVIPNAAAASLRVGLNAGSVEFKNLTSGATRVRGVKLLCGGPEYFTELFSNDDNDTDNQSFSFSPQDSSNGYAVSRTSVTSFPVAPAGGTILTLTDDDAVKVDLAGGKQVRLYGEVYSSFYVGSNGYITFTAADTSPTASFDSHFAQPRVAALIADLNPSNLDPNLGRFVSWKQMPDRAVVTWSGVPTYQTSDSNSFQIELFFDGRIRITLLALGNSGGLIGLSVGGGTPANLVESNFAAYPLNQLPTISAIPNQTLIQDTATGELAFTVGDSETAAGALTVTAAAQSPALVPAEGLILAGTGANRTLRVVPSPSGTGSTEILVQVTDELGASSSTSFTLTVNAQAPLIDTVANVLLIEDAPIAPVGLTGIRSGSLGAPLPLTVTANSSRPDLLPNPVVQYTTGGTGATLLLNPTFLGEGIALVTVTVSDGRPEGGTTTTTFQVEIRLRNFAPSFQKGSDQVALEDSGLQSVSQWATGISPGRASEAGQVLNFELIHDAPGLFSVQPSLSDIGTLTYQAAPDASGIATVQVRLRDNGGTNYGGVDTSAPQTLKITINPVNDTPSFVPGANVNVPLGTLAYSGPGWASQVSAGPPNEGAQGLKFFVEAADKSLFSVQPAVSPTGTLTFTPAPKVSGDTVVYIRLEDTGGTDFGGVAATSTTQFKIAITTNANQAGEFNGLIEPLVLPATSTQHLGLARINIARGGAFSGNLRLGVVNYPIRGKFDESGIARFGKTNEPQVTILRKGLPSLVVALQVDVLNGTGKLLGTIAEGNTPVASIQTDRLLYTAAKAPKSPNLNVPADILGVSTVALAPAADLPLVAFPQGYGIGVLTVAASGRATLVGKLADGSPVSYSNAVAIGKKLPLYTTYALPKGAVGTLSGWVPLNNPTDQDDFEATLRWLRPVTTSPTYPAGWPTGIPLQLQGSRWLPMAANGAPMRFPGLMATGFSGNILMKFSGGLLPGAGFQVSANLTNKNAIVPVGINTQSLSSGSVGATGLSSGSFNHPVTGSKPRFEAVILQKRRRALGFFLSPQESGAVQVEPR